VCQHPHGALRTGAADALTSLVKSTLSFEHDPPVHSQPVSLIVVKFSHRICTHARTQFLSDHSNGLSGPVVCVCVCLYVTLVYEGRSKSLWTDIDRHYKFY